jgi:hypothetical protein
MIETQNIEREVYRSLERILLRAKGILRSDINKDNLMSWMQFSSRLHGNFPALFALPLHAAQIQHSNKDHYHEK